MSNNQPCVSIGIPVYNGENFLAKTLDSLLAQTFQDFEIIISDNASTDKTEEICREYAAKYECIRYSRQEKNLGAAPNYNYVFEVSKGKYFKWAAHDDLCAPTYLERCVDILENNPSVVLVYPRSIFINEQDEPIENYYEHSLHDDPLNLPFPTPNERFKRYQDGLRASGVCNPVFGLIRSSALKLTPVMGSYISSDMVLLAELALLGQFSEIKEPLFMRRIHMQMSTAANLNYQQRLTWFNSSQKKKFIFRTWRLFFELLASINRVQMKINEKISCYMEMIKWLYFEKRNLLTELMVNTAQMMGISSVSYKNYH
ncbi:MAG: glycosyltransferase family 2 protein [Nostocaceae cyanobacterium]|nr:glycosyltransferase family 2 protein [Nostocaceae cyanobacterium]